MARGDLEIDARGLIREAYRIEGITASECRSIFLDWAIGAARDPERADLERLLAHYGPAHPEHPMTAILREGLGRAAPPPRRRRRPVA